jgi:hypothetical protein
MAHHTTPPANPSRAPYSNSAKRCQVRKGRRHILHASRYATQRRDASGVNQQLLHGLHGNHAHHEAQFHTQEWYKRGRDTAGSHDGGIPDVHEIHQPGKQGRPTAGHRITRKRASRLRAKRKRSPVGDGPCQRRKHHQHLKHQARQSRSWLPGGGARGSGLVAGTACSPPA